MIERLFHLQRNGTTWRREMLAAVTTFVTVCYVMIVEPSLLSESGISAASAFVATGVVIAFGSLLSGLISNLPIAFGPGLGLLSFFAYVVTKENNYHWQSALGIVFIAGLLFFLITITPIRKKIIQAIPKSLGCAIAAGIGIFIGFIALKNVGFVIPNSNTYITLGDINTIKMGLFLFGFCLIVILSEKRIPGAILIGIILITVISMALGLTPYHGIVAWPHSDLSSFNAISFHHLNNIQAYSLIFTFIIVALFDSTGALIGLTHFLPHTDVKTDRRVNKALLAESIATLAAAFCGTTTAAPFIENTAGIQAGGRTGLTACFVACFFLISLFFLPLASSVPVYATSAALFYVACQMLKPLAHIEWQDYREYIPAVVTLMLIPLTFSIADGVGFGVIAYVIFHTSEGRLKKVHPMLWILAAIFCIDFMM